MRKPSFDAIDPQVVPTPPGGSIYLINLLILHSSVGTFSPVFDENTTATALPCHLSGMCVCAGLSPSLPPRTGTARQTKAAPRQALPGTQQRFTLHRVREMSMLEVLHVLDTTCADNTRHRAVDHFRSCKVALTQNELKGAETDAGKPTRSPSIDRTMYIATVAASVPMEGFAAPSATYLLRIKWYILCKAMRPPRASH